MAWLPSAIANKLDFYGPMEVPPTKFSFDEAKLNQWRATLMWTKDASLLSQYETQPIFIYDRLMEGQDDYSKIKDHIQPRFSWGFTSQRFCNWQKNLGKLSFPIALDTQTQPLDIPWADLARETCWFRDAPPARIKGAVYNISTKAFFELDKLYRNGLHFTRRKVKILIPYQAKKENGGTDYLVGLWCWMYVGNQDHWEKQLDAGMFFKPVKIYPLQHTGLSDYSFFDVPTGEVPHEGMPATHIKKWVPKSFPLLDERNKVVGSGFELVEKEMPVEANPYYNQIDGASPVQRLAAEE